MTGREERSPPPLTDAQLEIMNAVWELGGATVAEVRRRLSREREIARNTIQTTMARLEEKGWLRHEREGNTFRYHPVLSRERARRRILSRMIATVFDGSAKALVAALLDGPGVDPEEAEAIGRMLDEAERAEEER